MVRDAVADILWVMEHSKGQNYDTNRFIMRFGMLCLGTVD